MKLSSISVTVWDSPGLQDGTANESKYLADIKRKCTNIDLFLYCIWMSETRFPPGCPDEKAMSLLTSTLGPALWENAMIVLTYGNEVVSIGEDKFGDSNHDIQAYFQKTFNKWITRLGECLNRNLQLTQEMVNKVSIVPAGHYCTPYLPNTELKSTVTQTHWLSDLWLKSLHRTKLDAQPAMIKLNLYRMKMKREDYGLVDEMRSKVLEVQPSMYAKKGSEIGKKNLKIPEAETIGKLVGRVEGANITASILLKLAEENQII